MLSFYALSFLSFEYNKTALRCYINWTIFIHFWFKFCNW